MHSLCLFVCTSGGQKDICTFKAKISTLEIVKSKIYAAKGERGNGCMNPPQLVYHGKRQHRLLSDSCLISNASQYFFKCNDKWEKQSQYCMNKT